MIALLGYVKRITMYRLMLYLLIALVALAVLLSVFDVLPYSPIALMVHAVAFVAVCWVINRGFAIFLNVRENIESSFITGLILALIVGPLTLPGDMFALFVISAVAIASKYVLVVHAHHIFNPAAAGVLAGALLVEHPASWWVGNQPMLPFVLLGGGLVVWVIRRVHLAVSFLVAYVFLLLLDLVVLYDAGWGTAMTVMQNIVLFTPLVFFAFVMVVEPLTSPSTLRGRVWFGVLVGVVLFALHQFFAHIPFSFEVSLLIGNVFAMAVFPSFRQVLALRKKEITSRIGLFWFHSHRSFTFIPGQFLEYTLVHARPDSRGVRRYFTIASSPTEDGVLLATTFYEKGSSFKRALKNMEEGDEVVASEASGDFVLPSNPDQKMVWIAGGIGVTPYRSMAKYLIDTDQKRDVILLYGARNEGEMMFQDVFREAHKECGVRVVHVLSAPSQSWSGYTGYVTEEVVRSEVSDMSDRLFYISGPEPMVHNMERMLAKMGVSYRNIRRDYFPGYTESV